MSPGTSNKKRFIPLLFMALTLAVLLMLCVGSVLLGSRSEIASIVHADTYLIELWAESPGMLSAEWDPDHAYPEIYYRISDDDSEIVPTTFLTAGRELPSSINFAATDDENLVVVYDAEQWRDRIFIIFDVERNISWPRVLFDEGSLDLTVKQKWAESYRQLRLQNPSLPKTSFFPTTESTPTP